MKRRLYALRFALARRSCSGCVALQGTCRVDVPIRIDGKGSIRLGSNVCLGYGLAARSGNGEILLQARTPESNICIGAHTMLSNNVSLIAASSIKIGDHALIGDHVMIVDSDFHSLEPAQRRTSTGETKPVELENHTWIGSRVLIMKGVVIGENSIVGAGSVVTRSIPPNVVAAGNPARPIRNL